MRASIQIRSSAFTESGTPQFTNLLSAACRTSDAAANRLSKDTARLEEPVTFPAKS